VEILTAISVLVLISAWLIVGINLAAHWLLEKDAQLISSNRPVSILRPLKGNIPGLEENLESLCKQDHPEFEIIVAAADAADPALLVARRVREKFPQVSFKILNGEWATGLNPKVRMLRGMLGHARYGTLLISDDNVRAQPNYLRVTAGALSQPGTGLVSNLVVGVGGNSLGSLCENLQLNGFVLSSVAASYLARYPVVVGKSMMFRRDALMNAGGLGAVADVLAEDHLLGRAIAAAGYRVVTIGHPVYTVNSGWSVGRMLSRHIRWSKIRASIAPLVFPLELLAQPLLLWFLLLAISLTTTIAVPETLLLVAGASAAIATVSELTVIRRVQGAEFRIWHSLLIPLRSALALTAHVASYFTPTVRWRDVSYRIGHNSRLIPLREAPTSYARIPLKRAA
jgi:ceramide glucosyltransferase